jgi:D-alanyl-lipoteichoic acid acyltransferase DltB (MBOAT superfamily)
MLFNSLHFAVFFPIVTIAFFLLSGRARWLLLLVASAYFYMALVPAYIVILLLLITIDFAAGIKIDESEGAKRKLWLWLSLTANLSILFFFKYLWFALEQVSWLSGQLGSHWVVPTLKLALPVGLSFHTFQSLAYTIDVYRRTERAERNFAVYALYVLFYPQLVAGPIERPQRLLPQLHELPGVKFDATRASSGLRLMLWGLLKKVVVADGLAALVNRTYADVGHADSVALLVAAYAFSVQIYCDFSGYTDIARGAARVMGVELMQNFARPYAARSFGEFWHRWHISLSTWFRDYLYIPLGGSRAGLPRNIRNLLIVFVVSGLWHGANWTFAVWGALHGGFLIGELLLKRALGGRTFSGTVWSVVRWVVVFHGVSLAWVFFRARNLTEALQYLSRLSSGVGLRSSHGHNLGSPLQLAFVFGVSVLVIGLESLNKRLDLWQRLERAPVAPRWLAYYAGVLLLLSSLGSSPQQFIYFQF